MPRVSQSISKDLLQMYSGYDQQAVGLGLQTGAYATPDYAKKKIGSIVLGGVTKFTYGPFDTDMRPTALIMGYEPQYNTVIGINLRYGTPRIRQAILKFVLDANKTRIKSNTPLVISYDALKRAVPAVQYMVRRYKVIGIGAANLETVPLLEWPNVAKESTPFDGYYLKYKNGKK